MNDTYQILKTKVIEDFRNLKSISDIAKEYHLDPTTVQNILTEAYQLQQKLGDMGYKIFILAREASEWAKFIYDDKFLKNYPSANSRYKRIEQIIVELREIKNQLMKKEE